VPILVRYFHECWAGAIRTSKNAVKAKFAEFFYGEVRRIYLLGIPMNKG
jgi:hypothetical protein